MRQPQITSSSFEVSETEHLETVTEMKKKESLYDYGSYDPSSRRGVE